MCSSDLTWADEAIWGFYDAAGWAVTPIAGGDLTGDGTASIVVASANHGSGLIYLLPEGGGTDLTPADALAIVSGTDDSGGLSGPMVVLRSGAGGDALAVSDNAGGLFLFDAPVTDLRTGESADLRLTSPSEGWGGAVYPTGDLDQDGVDDMRVIGTAADGSVPEFLVSGRERGTADLESVSFGWIDGLNGHPAGPATGSSWDVNGDGVPDVVDACTPTDVSLGGVVYVFEGPVSGALDASLAAITMEAPETGGPRFGYTLDVADLDEDGAPDVIVGAPPWNPTAIVVGRIFVYSHATDGTLQPEPSVTIEGPMGSMFGRSVLAWPSEVTQRMELFGGSNRDAAGDGRAVVYYFEALGSGVHTTTEAALALTDGADWFGDALHRSDSGALLLSDTDGTARALNITR